MKRLVLFAAYFVLMAGAATAQQSERFDQFELHRSVVYHHVFNARNRGGIRHSSRKIQSDSYAISA